MRSRPDYGPGLGRVLAERDHSRIICMEKGHRRRARAWTDRPKGTTGQPFASRHPRRWRVGADEKDARADDHSGASITRVNRTKIGSSLSPAFGVGTRD